MKDRDRKSNYKHILKERDYKGSKDNERNGRSKYDERSKIRSKDYEHNEKRSKSDEHSERRKKEGERHERRNKDKTIDARRSSNHPHKKRSSSPHRSSHRRNSPLKSKVECNSLNVMNSESNERELNELSRRKRKLESELRALDLEEAAAREAETKKIRKEKFEKKENPDLRNKLSRRSDDTDKKSSKRKAQNSVVKVKVEKYENHASTSSENESNWGKPNQESKKLNKEKPNFEVSGKLAEETNTYNGVVIKYNEPAEARKPKRKWRLYPFKGDSDLPFIPIHRQSAYLFGRTRLIADIPIDHPSCSKQHAVLQFRLIPYKRDDGTTGRRVRPYIIDLESSNGTFVNNQKITPRCYVELVEKDVIKFGYSSREYVLLHEESKNEEEDDDVLETND